MHEMKSNLPPGMKGFFAWMHATHPDLHARVVDRLARPGLSGIGITPPDETTAVTMSTQPASKTTVQKVSDLITTLSQGYLTVTQLQAQKKMMDLQLKRAQEGLPPLNINPEQYGLTPQVSVGITSDTKKMLTIGAVAAALLYLVPKFLRRRR